MAIADRINEMYTHVGDVYDTITNVDLPTNKNIQNIPQTIKDSYLEIMNNGIDRIWNNWEKVTGEGTSLTLNNTEQAPMRNLPKGNTSQTGTPTPSSSIPVNVVSGDNEIIITNEDNTDSNTYNIDLPVENLLDLSQFTTRTINGVTFTKNEDSSITLNGTCTSAITLDISITPITLQSGVSYTLSQRTTYANSNYSLSLRQQNKTNVGTSGLDSGSNSLTYNLASTTEVYYFRIFVVVNKTFSNHTIYPILEKSNKNNGYSPYGTTPIELCKIGNYQDYFYKDSDKWYLYKAIGKYTFTGNESFTLSQTTNVFYLNNAYDNALIDDTSTPLCTIFQGAVARVNASTVGNNANNSVCLDKGTNKRFYFKTDAYSTTSDLATGLTGKSIYWIYETPTNIEITYQPLIDQLNELEKAISYENQTNISQVNNDLPFIISASALKKG